ncbi:hypothetical protein TrST_g11321 [Triparma strigata]|uniref:Uncharacterized protein n=1 Tax=Triparma strigata TaxID=1606541 RepID=A0A9W7EA37_9STRA|nr:hypothetical protein TrST_g11321 [Triparma strigata]
MKQVTNIVFLLNITKVGYCACLRASILVAVDIPEGITIIGKDSFGCCISLKSITFPKSLTYIGEYSFGYCSSLEEVDLLHTHVRELGTWAFAGCTSLREMKIPDSLQKFGGSVFTNCSKLFPSTIDIDDEIDEDDVTSEAIAYLRSRQ